MVKTSQENISTLLNDSRHDVRRGLSIPSITVLDSDGKVIEEDQRKLFRYNAQEGKGADVIFGVGTTGEYNRISNTERQRLIRIQAEEIKRINGSLSGQGNSKVEGWIGITAETKALTLENIECAIDHQTDAVVIAPLSIGDLKDIVSFFHRDINDLLEKKGKYLPIFLYDNRDIAVDPKRQHLKTFDVKRLSRLPYVYGIKVSASRRVLGNYMRGASHYNDTGGFAIYIGNALLMFDVFHLEDSLWGKVREYWNRFLMHDTLPIGVVSGPGNVFPREWKRAWYASYTGDEHLMAIYRDIFKRFNNAYCFPQGSEIQEKAMACFKYALKLDGVIASDSVAAGTPSLSGDERRQFEDVYLKLKEEIKEKCPANWVSTA